MSEDVSNGLDRGLNALTGRRDLLKGASGLALGSLGMAAWAGSRPRPWRRTPPRPPRRARPATSRTSSSSWATTSAG